MITRDVAQPAVTGLIGVCALIVVSASTTAAPPCLQARVTATDGSGGDSFGWSVAAAASTIFVGAFWDNDLGADSGSTYVFRQTANGWTQVQKLLASDGHAGDWFGYTLAVQGETLYVGSGHLHAPGAGTGAAFVQRLMNNRWMEHQELRASDGAWQDLFAGSVSINGDVAIIGAKFHDALGANSGAAYVFRFNPATKLWVQEQKLLAADGLEGDFFGASVAVENDIILVGANSDASELGSSAGSAYVFRYNGTLWVQEQKLLPDSIGASQAAFGESASISNGVLLIGAPNQSLPTGFARGAVHFFQHDGTQWVRTQKIDGPDTWTRKFGKSVAIDGQLAVVGAYSSNSIGDAAGAAYVYRFNPQSKLWGQHGPTLLPTLGGGPFFGFSVGLSGTMAVVGAYGENGQRGAAYIYNIDPNPADLNCDSIINSLDLGIMLVSWSIPPRAPGCDGDSPCLADLNTDGVVNSLDLGILLSSWTLK